MTNVILASNSPRRRELFKEICSSFLAEGEDIDESGAKSLAPLECVTELASEKAKACIDKHPDSLVVACDTIVVLDGEIIGKPVDYSDAANILRKESGKTHEVITAYCLQYQGKKLQNHVHSYVKFNKLDDELIEKYLNEFHPYDKAGAYGIQDSSKEYPLIEEFSGSFTNIMGFPLSEIKKDLFSFCVKLEINPDFLI
ncbi:MAG: Maf family protein [Coprobacillus sp.]|nr:Maf family protein [Coprobacillus sp.]